jgi:Spy/CpxP family protein refolding chaperone
MSKVSYALGLALAMSLGAVATSGAQTAQRPEGAQQQQGMRRGPGGRGEGMLLKGINLTETQKQQVKTLRESQRKEFEALRAKREQKGTVARAPRDTTGWGARRAEMGKRREQQVASLRNVLTPAQRVQFDKNVAEMQARRNNR